MADDALDPHTLDICFVILPASFPQIAPRLNGSGSVLTTISLRYVPVLEAAFT